jgi:hypothetical protein
MNLSLDSYGLPESDEDLEAMRTKIDADGSSLECLDHLLHVGINVRYRVEKSFHVHHQRGRMIHEGGFYMFQHDGSELGGGESLWLWPFVLEPGVRNCQEDKGCSTRRSEKVI